VSKDSARSGLSSDRNELFMVCIKVVGFQKLVWNVGCCFFFGMEEEWREDVERQSEIAKRQDKKSSIGLSAWSRRD